MAGVGLYYIVDKSDTLEKRWLQSSFRGAVQFHRMQSKCGKLNKQLGDLSDERHKLELSIKEIEASSPSSDDDRSTELSRSLSMKPGRALDARSLHAPRGGHRTAALCHGSAAGGGVQVASGG